MSDNDTEKTESATPERRKKAREEGQFPRAKDAGPTVGTFGVLLCLASMAPTLEASLKQLALRAFSDPYNVMRGDPRALVSMVAPSLIVLCLPTTIAAVAASVAIGFAEAGYHPNLELASPKWSRLDPIGRLSQMFSPKEMASTITLLLLRVAVVGTVVYLTLKSEFPQLSKLARANLPAATLAVATSIFRLGIWASVALVVMGAADYLQSFFSHEKKMMMSRQELKEEMKQSEGDPHVKGKQRARARENLRRGLRKQVKRADVIVANPTHVSVALRYRAEEGAPVVCAKGVDEVALFIREIAKEHNIPVVTNIPLARVLNKRVKAGRAIPVDLYKAVAELLAFVYRLRARGPSIRA